MVIKMVGTKRNITEEDLVKPLTENKSSKDKAKKKVENVNIQDTETIIAQELNGIDSNEDSDDSDSSVYSDLDDDEEDNSSQDENESDEMSTHDDEDSNESDE